MNRKNDYIAEAYKKMYGHPISEANYLSPNKLDRETGLPVRKGRKRRKR